MLKTNQLPLYELTRGELVESIHYGSIAISDNQGRLVGWYGDPHTRTFLRSSAKPFQALPFIEQNGPGYFELSLEEVAVICASHSGTDNHVSTIRSIQKKTGVNESQLMCGIHPVFDEATAEIMRERGEELTPNRHNCSGKHTGMLAFAHMQNWSTSDYLEFDHKIQSRILITFSEMSGVPKDDVIVGVNGCSAPNFAVPLHNTALAYARLCDPEDFSKERAEACRVITSAMMSNSFMVGGPGRFDTRLMEVTSGQIVSKGGAEGYQALGIMPGALGVDSPALGIAFKISDGDLRSRARPAISLEILRQLNALTPEQESELSEFGPSRPLKNWREIEVGGTNPAFRLNLISSI
jgi:L-asparaginase II